MAESTATPGTSAAALTFTFSAQDLRVIMIDGEPWFVASDLLEALTLDRKALERLDEDEKGVNTIHTLGGEQEMTIINESGLYSLILTSRKPEAKKFKKWVTAEVLPSIRKTGAYIASNALTRAIAPTLTVIDGRPTTTSADVARHFGKRHDDVLKAIRNLLPQLSAEHARNFAEMFTETQIGQGATRQDPAYRITKKGFTLLAFGFTGKKALQFKLDYIDEFERLEAELSGKAGQLPGPHPQPALPNALRQISAPELPAIDVRALLTTGQSEPVSMTPAQLALIEEKTWQLLGEARGLIQTHILRAVAFRSTSTDRADPQCRHIASVVNEITLNKALAQSYWTELRHLKVCAQMALGVAQDNIRHLDDALTGKGLDATVPLKTKKETP